MSSISDIFVTRRSLTRRVPLVEQELRTLLEHLSSPSFYWGSCYSIFSFMCMFCRSLFVLLSFFFLQLCCLFFFDLRILIALLVSSSSSKNNKYHIRPVMVFIWLSAPPNNICGEMVNVLDSSVVDRVFEPDCVKPKTVKLVFVASPRTRSTK